MILHDLDFTDPQLPEGCGRCVRCGQAVTAEEWVRERCPEPPTLKQEDHDGQDD